MDILLILMRLIIVGALGLCVVTDVKSRIIPTSALVVTVGAWVVETLVSSPVWYVQVAERVACACAIGFLLIAVAAVYERVRGKQSMGGGDVKLFMVVSMLVGLEQALVVMVLSCVLGLVMARVWYRGCEYFPLGPAIVVSTYVFLVTQWV